jgi:drug/metabolite transporter (DMT)-like permease
MSADGRRRAIGRLMVLGAASLWGTSATLARFVFHTQHVPPLQVVELRLVFAVLILAPWLALRHPGLLRVRRDAWPYFALLGIGGVATVQATYYASIARLGVGLAILLQYVAPSLVVLYEVLRGRRVGPLVVGSVLAATAGTGLLVSGEGLAAVRARPLDWGIGVASAFAFAFYLLCSKRGLDRHPPATVLVHSFAIAALFWMIVTPPWRIVAAHYPLALWGMFLALGIFSTLAPFLLFINGLERLPAPEAAILATFEPVVAVVTAWVFLSEGLRPIQWAGAALVLAATVMATMWESSGTSGSPRMDATPGVMGTPPGH